MLSQKWKGIEKYVSELQLIEDTKEMLIEINEIKILTEKRLKKISESVTFEDKIDMMNICLNTITQFLHTEIFPGTETTFQSKELHNKYKDWCKEESTRIPYGKNKFYERLKFEPRIEHKHMSTGDYFVFDLDKEKQEEI